MRIPAEVVTICQTLNDNGHSAWVVGGAVRDFLLGREAHDWDVATDAHPNTVRNLFSRVIDTGIKHGTVTVLLGEGAFEVTTFRGEDGYSDGRRPDTIRFLNTIEEDLARRDFTVNAIAFDPLSGEFCDPFGGRQDLENGLLRAVGNPHQRFAEDGLRVLRAARFAATLGFDIHPDTLAAIPASLDTYDKVAKERVQAEWLKALQSPQPSKAFQVMEAVGILERTAPELCEMVRCSQNRYHSFDVWVHTMQVMDACPASDPILRLAALLHDVGKPRTKAAHPVTGDSTFYDHEIVGAEMAHEIMVRLRFSCEERSRVTHLVRHHFIRYESSWSDYAVRRWIRKVGLSNVADLCTLARADIAGKGQDALVRLETSVIDELETRVAGMKETPVTVSGLAVNGKDVMDHLGIKPGPAVGIVLKNLLDEVVRNPEHNTKEVLLGIATQMILGGP